MRLEANCLDQVGIGGGGGIAQVSLLGAQHHLRQERRVDHSTKPTRSASAVGGGGGGGGGGALSQARLAVHFRENGEVVHMTSARRNDDYDIKMLQQKAQQAERLPPVSRRADLRENHPSLISRYSLSTGEPVPRLLREIFMVSVLLFVFIFIFAIYGVHLFGGRLGICNDRSKRTRAECSCTKAELDGGGATEFWWDQAEFFGQYPRNFNFDNACAGGAGLSCVALFEVLVVVANYALTSLREHRAGTVVCAGTVECEGPKRLAAHVDTETKKLQPQPNPRAKYRLGYIVHAFRLGLGETGGGQGGMTDYTTQPHRLFKALILDALPPSFSIPSGCSYLPAVFGAAAARRPPPLEVSTKKSPVPLPRVPLVTVGASNIFPAGQVFPPHCSPLPPTALGASSLPIGSRGCSAKCPRLPRVSRAAGVAIAAAEVAPQSTTGPGERQEVDTAAVRPGSIIHRQQPASLARTIGRSDSKRRCTSTRSHSRHSTIHFHSPSDHQHQQQKHQQITRSPVLTAHRQPACLRHGPARRLDRPRMAVGSVSKRSDAGVSDDNEIKNGSSCEAHRGHLASKHNGVRSRSFLCTAAVRIEGLVEKRNGLAVRGSSMTIFQRRQVELEFL
uniref:Uncharacterized protein n=1 Tax=Macrostomum lignano TaxID=282301 RepID=A0A1I8FIG3_9PLAT